MGEVLGGARGERVRTAIATFIGREETTTGQPKSGGQWKIARENVESARGELDDVRRTLELLDADLRMLTAKLEEERKLGDRSVMVRMQAELAAASQEKTSAKEAQRAAEMAEGEVARLKPTLELADKKHQDLLEVDGRIAKSRARTTELTAQLTERQTAHDDKLRVAQGQKKNSQRQRTGILLRRRSTTQLQGFRLQRQMLIASPTFELGSNAHAACESK